MYCQDEDRLYYDKTKVYKFFDKRVHTELENFHSEINKIKNFSSLYIIIYDKYSNEVIYKCANTGIKNNKLSDKIAEIQENIHRSIGSSNYLENEDLVIDLFYFNAEEISRDNDFNLEYETDLRKDKKNFKLFLIPINNPISTITIILTILSFSFLNILVNIGIDLNNENLQNISILGGLLFYILHEYLVFIFIVFLMFGAILFGFLALITSLIVSLKKEKQKVNIFFSIIYLLIIILYIDILFLNYLFSNLFVFLEISYENYIYFYLFLGLFFFLIILVLFVIQEKYIKHSFIHRYFHSKNIVFQTQYTIILFGELLLFTFFIIVWSEKEEILKDYFQTRTHIVSTLNKEYLVWNGTPQLITNLVEINQQELIKICKSDTLETVKEVIIDNKTISIFDSQLKKDYKVTRSLAFFCNSNFRQNNNKFIKLFLHNK